MIKTPLSSEDAVLTAIAMSIQDLDDLLRLLAKGLSRAKPWQQSFAAHLTDADRQLQVLRLTSAMDRPTSEILDAAMGLQLVCGRAKRSLLGTRADKTTAAAMQLAVDLATAIVSGLQQITSVR